MATIQENRVTPEWVDDLYQIEMTDPVTGGSDGVANRQAKQLGQRTQWLKKAYEGQEEKFEQYKKSVSSASETASGITKLTDNVSAHEEDDDFAVSPRGVVKAIESKNPIITDISLLRTSVPSSVGIVILSRATGSHVGGGIFVFDPNDRTSPDDGVYTIVGLDGARWKLQKNNNYDGITKNYRVVRHNLPIDFPEIAKALEELNDGQDTWIYPQAFTVFGGEYYILYQSNHSFRYAVVVYDFYSGNYNGYYLITDGAAGFREGIVVDGDYIYVGIGNQIAKYRKGKFARSLQKVASYDVNLKAQFNYDAQAEEWYVEQNFSVAGNLSTRTKFAVYDKHFNYLRGFQLPLAMSGYSSGSDNFHKRQSFAVAAGVVYAGLGGLWNETMAETPRLMQGVARFDGQARFNMYSPSLLMDKYKEMGYSPARLENEGIAIYDGKVITLTCANPSEVESAQGLIFCEEYSSNPEAVDFSDCAVFGVYNHEPLDNLYSTNGVNGVMINPLTGREFVDLAEICNVMNELQQKRLSIWVGSNGSLKVSTEYTVQRYSEIKIENQNGSTYRVHVKGSFKTCPADFLFYPSSSTVTILDTEFSGDLKWQAKESLQTYHRMYSEDHEGRLFNFIDVQHRREGGDYLYLGGSSSLAYSVDQVKIGVNLADGEKGGDTFWIFDNTGAFVPNYHNRSDIGKSGKAIANIYLGASPTIVSDERAKQDIAAIPDNIINAWRAVNFCQYRFIDAVNLKGVGARYHTGLIAQRIKEVFAEHGLDAQDYGLLCYDQLPETPAREAVFDETGNVLEEAVAYQPAGERWGIRADECLFLEAESNRRLIAELFLRIGKLEKKL